MSQSVTQTRYAIVAEGLSRRQAEDLNLLLASAAIEARIGQALYVPAAETTGRARWVVEVDRGDLERARRLIASEENSPPASADPPPLALGHRAGAYWVVGLILTNALIWYAMEMSGGSETRSTLLRFGASMTELIGAGQWWRTVSAVFLHIGARHLIGNSILLLVLGLICLREWGPGRLLFIYLFSGVLGNWAGFAFGSAVALKAGASGAILGLLGRPGRNPRATDASQPRAALAIQGLACARHARRVLRLCRRRASHI
jgi:membrane associated rhomboid family serine protease